MTQRHFIQSDVPMLVTTATHDRKAVFLDPTFAHEAIECLYRVQERHPFHLYAFAILPDHQHFLLTVPSPNTISHVMNVYKSGLVFDLGMKRLWQRRFHLRLVEDLAAACLYIHENPCKAGLCDSAVDYPWSSASGKWDVSPLPLD